MNRAFRVFLVLFLALSALGVPVAALAKGTQDNVPERYIVSFSPGVGNAGIFANQLAQNNGFHVGQSFDTLIKGFTAELTPRQARILQAISGVASIEPDAVARIADLPPQTVPTGIERIGTLDNGTASIGSQTDLNIGVATLDTGIDTSNSDLNAAGGFNAINASNCSISGNSGNYSDDNGHGTHVAGTIAAKDNGVGVVGVAPGAKVYAVKVFDSSGSGYVSSIICGLNWIAANASTDNIRAINFSGTWSGSNTANCGNSYFWFFADTAHQAVCNIVNNYHIPLIVAAGNDGANASNSLPAAYPETIAVGAIADSDGKPGGLGPSTQYGADDTRATFSNYGSVVTVYAPGVNILSDWPSTVSGGTNGLYVASGTSMATPHVTGAALLYILNHPNATPSQVQNAIVADGEAGTWGNPYGSQPLLNVANADFGPVVPPTPSHDVVVTNITAPSPVVNGVPTTVTVHIQNNGNVAESNLNVTLTNSTTNTSLGTNAAPTSPLPAGSGEDVTFSWTPTQTGSNAFSAEVKNNDNDNTGTGNITVDAVSHSISVTGVGAVTSPAYTGTANSVTANIKNNGNVTESISVKLQDSLGSTITSSPQSISLAAGASQGVTFGWTPTAAGTHNFTVTATANATDFTGVGSENVTTQVDDVQVTSVTVPSQATQGQSVTVSVGLANVGAFQESVTVALTGASNLPAPQTVTLNSQATTTLSFTWDTTSVSPANYTLTATATLGNSKTDNTPANNVGTSNQITINPKPVNQNIWVTGLTATNSASRTITGTVSIGSGSGPVSGATVTLNITGFFTNYSIQVTTNASGVAQYSASIYWRTTYTVSVTGVSHGSDTYDSGQNVVTSVSVYAR